MNCESKSTKSAAMRWAPAAAPPHHNILADAPNKNKLRDSTVARRGAKKGKGFGTPCFTSWALPCSKAKEGERLRLDELYTVDDASALAIADLTTTSEPKSTPTPDSGGQKTPTSLDTSSSVPPVARSRSSQSVDDESKRKVKKRRLTDDNKERQTLRDPQTLGLLPLNFAEHDHSIARIDVALDMCAAALGLDVQSITHLRLEQSSGLANAKQQAQLDAWNTRTPAEQEALLQQLKGSDSCDTEPYKFDPASVCNYDPVGVRETCAANVDSVAAVLHFSPAARDAHVLDFKTCRSAIDSLVRANGPEVQQCRQAPPLAVTEYERAMAYHMTPFMSRVLVARLNGRDLAPAADAGGGGGALRAVAQAAKSFRVDVDAIDVKEMQCSEKTLLDHINWLEAAIEDKSLSEFLYMYSTRVTPNVRAVYRRRIQQLRQRVRAIAVTLVGLHYQTPGFKPSLEPTPLEQQVMGVGAPLDPANQSKYVRALVRFEEIARHAGIRIAEDGGVYVEHKLADQPTNAFTRRHDKVYDWLCKSRPKNMMDPDFDLLVSHTTERLATQLASSGEVQSLVRNQSLFSCRNGIFDALNVEFHRYGSEGCDALTEASATFIDLEFQLEWLDQSIDVLEGAEMKKLCQTQQFDDDVKRWLYAMMGRCLVPLHTHDHWDVMPWLIGKPGTGKTTMWHAVSQLYDSKDVGTLQNNVEKQFGLETLYRRFMIVMPDIKKNFALEPSIYLQMLGGDPVSVARKNKTEVTEDPWRVPAIAAANEIPDWASVAGVARRTVFFPFDHKVTSATCDTTLTANLKAHRLALLVLFARCYRDLREQVGSDSIWKHVPQKLSNTRRTKAIEAAPLGPMLCKCLQVASVREDGTPPPRVLLTDLMQPAKLTLSCISLRGHTSTEVARQIANDANAVFDDVIVRCDADNTPIWLEGCRLKLHQFRREIRSNEWLPSLDPATGFASDIFVEQDAPPVATT